MSRFRLLVVFGISLAVLGSQTALADDPCNLLAEQKQRTLTLAERYELVRLEKAGKLRNCFIEQSSNPCQILAAQQVRPLSLAEEYVLERASERELTCPQ